MIGWGAIREGGGQPNVLQQVTVQIMTNDKCKSMYGSDAPGGIVDHMLCAAYPNKDSCSVSETSKLTFNCNLLLTCQQGDSGGPLLVQSSAGSPWVQTGIVSWGIGIDIEHLNCRNLMTFKRFRLRPSQISRCLRPRDIVHELDRQEHVIVAHFILKERDR